MVMTEFAKLKKIENYRGKNNTDEIGCVISIGTGIEPSAPINGIDINLTHGITGITGNWKEVFANAKNLITVFLYQVRNEGCFETGHELSEMRNRTFLGGKRNKANI